MSGGPLDDYLRELERALRMRGYVSPRTIDEAREHLADAAEDGLRRGLTHEDAEREAVVRFGDPDLVAALLTAAAGYYLLPKAYESQSAIAVTSEQWPDGLKPISEAVLSDPRLETMARDFGLGAGTPDVRRRIAVEIHETPNQFSLKFRSADPQQAQRVTERLASLFIQQNFEQATSGRQTGAVFKVVQPPTLPQQADTPGLEKAAATGAFGGLALSIAALAWRKEPFSKD